MQHAGATETTGSIEIDEGRETTDCAGTTDAAGRTDVTTSRLLATGLPGHGRPRRGGSDRVPQSRARRGARR